MTARRCRRSAHRSARSAVSAISCRRPASTFSPPRSCSNIETLDVLINAAGSGFERTLGMYRVSNALLPALRNNPGRTFIFNVPPASNRRRRTSSLMLDRGRPFCGCARCLRTELRGSPVSVRVACQQRLQIGTVQAAADVEDYDSAGAEGPVQDNAAALATRIASLIFFSDASDRRRTLMSPPRAERKVGGADRRFGAGRQGCVPLSRAREIKEPA